MVVLAASICTRGGKPVLSRQFREMPRSRIEGLLAAFPKLTDAGTQHTTIETENVRYVYQPLDELYMVLITNRASNILQDIDSLHVFAQVVTSICKSLDEREILRNSFELLSAFDEVVALGYRENLSLQQIRTFLEMESHEERIQEIISRNKEFEASEERKRKAKQLEMQRKEMSRSNQGGMGGGMGGGMAGGIGSSRGASRPTYTPSSKPDITYDSYESEKKKTTFSSAPKGKGMQLGRKSKTTDMFEKVRNEMGGDADERAPLVGASSTPSHEVSSPSQAYSFSDSSEGIAITISEQISAEVARDGNVKSFDIKGNLNVRISDPSLTRVKLGVSADTSTGAQFRIHPNFDKAAFNGGVLQLKDPSKEFPLTNQSLLRWQQKSGTAPIAFTIWVNQAGHGRYTVTVEYELQNEGNTLKDVVVSIPFQRSEPAVSSMDETYEVAGDSLDWTLPVVNEENATGAFEFEAEAEEESEFFPMKVGFRMEKPVVDVAVNDITLVESSESVEFSKEVKSVADNYIIV
ncbi:coatomer subunit delta [Sphaerosporella brunnea]|uniref:Coatomer subunit delta n=1 Tax=Sphaerosporella brunnea TaxID=1250544 RepID=A0A5J5FBI0_9PEZI|nr:coatomer subunit delta [Sphaerosporella brunnea]